MGTVGLAIIAKNEQANLPHLLHSIIGAFDRVVLLDTGSTDDTIDVFARWAKDESTHHQQFTWQTGSFEWNDDFAAARNEADRLLVYGDGNTPLVEWKSWADCDDELENANLLREVAENSKPEVTAWFGQYNYAQNEHGQCVISLKRERLIRASYQQPWIGRVHEAIPINQGVVAEMPDVIQWRHRKQENPDTIGVSNERNLQILSKWNEDEPGDTRVVGYLGVENMVRGNIAEAIAFFHEYNSLNPTWPEEHAQINRKLAQCYMMDGDAEYAMQAGLRGLTIDPTWTDSYLTLAEATYMQGEYQKSLQWAKMAAERGQPNSMLILNPLDYAVLPKKLMALALGELGQLDEACDLAETLPPDDFLSQKYTEWRNIRKREATANTFVMAAEQLIGHDEQVKALTLLEQCVPHFAMEHPKVCAARAEIRSRLQWANKPKDYADHYEYGGSKPEDFIAEENIDKLCEYLPRTNFLLEGLREQQAS